jgi:hypothetical protein
VVLLLIPQTVQINAAITELVGNSSVYIELRDEYMRILIRKFRQK